MIYCHQKQCHKVVGVPLQHLQRLVNGVVNVDKVFKSDSLLPLRLLQTGAQQVPVVRDRVVSVLVQGPQQLLKTLLHPVSLSKQRVLVYIESLQAKVNMTEK